MTSVTIRGLQEAQQGNLRLMAAMKPGGALDEAIRIGTIAAHRYAVIETHVDTGALRASHRTRLERGLFGTTGYVYIDPTGRNPRTGALTSQYGQFEHARGGEHAFYEKVVRKYGGHIGNQAVAGFVSRLP